jgi:hypothetical protein
MIALKGRIYMADADSHSDMLNELGINDDYLGASKKFVRLELSPKDGDPFSDVDTWALKVDQDIKPDWYSDEEYKPMAVEAVKEWAKTHIFVGVDGLKLNTGTNYYIKDCKDVEITGSASVEAWGSASVEAWGSASVKAWGSASVKAWGSASVEARDSASVEARGSAVVFNSIYFSWEKQSSLILSENATFKDNIGKVIYQSGDFKLVSVESGKTIGEAK